MSKDKKIQYDIIAIGDATEDIFVKIKTSKIIKNSDTSYYWMCFDHNHPLEITKVQRTVAGNAANLAVGCQRLKLNSALYSVLGSDDTAQEITEALKKEGVATDYIINDKVNEDSNSTVVINFKAERTQLIFHNRRKYKLPEFKKALWVYLTAMAENGSQIYNDLEKYIKKHKAKLGFNPGTYHIKSGLEKILKLIELSHVLILNVEETIELFKPNKTDFAKRKELVLYLLNYVKDHGPDIVLITDGKKGAYAYDGETYWHIPIFGSKPIERTGAGDSFSTGFISALMHDKSIPEALVWGSLNADSVIQYVGPQAGLLTKKQILEIIKKNPDYKAKRIKKPT